MIDMLQLAATFFCVMQRYVRRQSEDKWKGDSLWK